MRSMPVMTALALALLVFTIAPPPAHSFGLSGAAARVGGVDPDDADGAVLVGGHLELEQSDTRFHLQPGAMYWSSNGVSDFNPNFDVMYHFAPSTRLSPYLGAGAGMHFYSGNADDTDLGANFFGGLQVPSRSARLFLEGRYVATDRSQMSISGGVTFPIGRTFGD